MERQRVSTDIETLREVARVAGETSGVRRVVLFGSVARGEAGPDSDLDLLLVFDDDFFTPNPTLFEMMAPAGRASDALWALGYRFSVDLVPMRFGHLQRGESTIARVVQREGVVLHDAPSRGLRAEAMPWPAAFTAFLARPKGRDG